jgi:hypothetical protein
MQVRTQAISYIRNSFLLHMRDFDYIINLSDFIPRAVMENLPPLETFMHTTPDVECEHNEDIILLGSYTFMRSPGLITLYGDNLVSFFWRVALEIDREIPNIRWQLNDFEMLSEWVIDKTLWHERFHHSMDVLRHLFNVNTYHRLSEEALAVAYSYNYMSDKGCPNVKQCTIFGKFMSLAYQYTSPGYKDWKQFEDKKALELGICDYLSPNEAQELSGLEIPISEMVFSMLPVKNGFHQQLDFNKNRLLNKLVTDLTEQALKIGLTLETHTDFYVASKYKTMIFSKPGWEKYVIAIEIQKERIFGIYKKNHDNQLPENFFEHLNKNLNKKGKKSTQWAWYCKFDSPYIDWSGSIEPWLAIQSGKMAQIIIKEIPELAAEMDKKHVIQLTRVNRLELGNLDY